MKKFNLKKTLMLVSLVKVSVVMLFSLALADKLCLQTTVNKKNFKATHRSVVAAACPKGYTELADTASFKGATGAPGQNGTLDTSKCFRREQTATGQGTVSANSACLVSEFVVSSACSTNTYNSYLISNSLEVPINGLLGDQAYGRLTCYFDNVVPNEIYSVTAQVLCCSP